MSRSKQLPENRKGVALPLALFTLVIVAVMITAVFYVGRLEQRMGYNSLASTQAFEAAEAGVAAVLTNWTPSTFDTIPVGSTYTFPSVALGSNAVYTAAVRKLNSSLFLIQVEGRFLLAGQAVTRRQVARVVRLEAPSIPANAAVTSRVGTNVTDLPSISGRDTVPSGWGPFCPLPGADGAGIRDSLGASTITGACTGLVCIYGSPQVATDPSVSSTTFTQFGRYSFADLAAMAEKTVSGTISAIGPSFNTGPPVTCNTGDPDNWGDPLDPTSACGGYFPIVYAPGDLTFTGGRGQGILLVEGDLHFSGTAEFYGPVIVQGAAQVTGGHIVGALMVRNIPEINSWVEQTAAVSFSRCAVNRAVTGGARAGPIRERSWVQLY